MSSANAWFDRANPFYFFFFFSFFCFGLDRINSARIKKLAEQELNDSVYDADPIHKNKAGILVILIAKPRKF